MAIQNCKKFVVLALAALGSCIAIQQSVNAGGQIVAVSEPYCDNACERTKCQCFCHKLRMHGVYMRRCLSQKYVLLPTNPAIAP